MSVRVRKTEHSGAKKGQGGVCECLDPCTKDSDCPECDRLVVLRDDLAHARQVIDSEQ